MDPDRRSPEYDNCDDDEEQMVNGRPVSEVSAKELDDQLHRSELRSRYYGLLQELRVVLPGIQVLVAFLLTAPFSSRFEDLDTAGALLYMVALVTSVSATICCVAPTVHHRAGGRTARSARLVWAIRLTRLGLVLFASSLLTAVFCVSRFVENTWTAIGVTALLAVFFFTAWIGLPVTTSNSHLHRADSDPAER